MPMSFIEIDQALSEATETNLSSKRGKKRQNATVLRLNPMVQSTQQQQRTTTPAEDGGGGAGGGPDGGAAAAGVGGGGDGSGGGGGESADLRIGRWTAEETSYCDKLIAHFEAGNLPIPENIKLNDFLSNMLKSKQSRLTKKMKNARLSAKQYRRHAGYIVTDIEAREFSQLESAFFESIKCNMERCEIKFHMQEVWRELFSAYCNAIGFQKHVNVDAWLRSVEEMDRRNAIAKNAARHARRKVLTGVALTQDTLNPPTGVFIDPGHDEFVAPAMSQLLMDKNGECLTGPFGEDDDDTNTGATGWLNKRVRRTGAGAGTAAGGAVGGGGGAFSSRNRQMASSLFHTAPFVGKVIQYVQRRGLPFEHVDVWVPSVVPSTTLPAGDSSSNSAQQQQQQLQQQQDDDDKKCRLCFGGCATGETKIPPDNVQPVAMTSQAQFDLMSFGEYSQKFSFAIGCGLPGRVYSSGVSSWERGIQSAPQPLFERGGGAKQWGIETALGIPVPSPNVGRVVVVLYSRHDRPRDADLVTRIADELGRLLPSPRWKLVVDVGIPAPLPTAAVSNARTTSIVDSVSGAEDDTRMHDLLEVLRNHMPEDSNSPYAPFLPGFTSLRLLLLKSSRTPLEINILQLALGAFESYRLEGRSDSDVACMTARDCMILTRSAALTSLTPQLTATNSIQQQHESMATLHQHQYQPLQHAAQQPAQQQRQQQQQNAPQQHQHAHQQQRQQSLQQTLQQLQQQQALQHAQQQAHQLQQLQQQAPTTSTGVSNCNPKNGCCPAPSMTQQQEHQQPIDASARSAGISPLTAAGLNLPFFCINNQQHQVVMSGSIIQHPLPQQLPQSSIATTAATDTNNNTRTAASSTTPCGPAQQPQFDLSQFHGELCDFSVSAAQIAAFLQNEDASSFQ
jgi:hypothetical protein